MSALTAEDIVKLFEEDVRARKRLAELLISEPDIRLAIINAVLRDVATRRDVDELRREVSSLRERVVKVEGILSQLVERIGDLGKRIDMLEKTFNARLGDLDKRINMLEKTFSARLEDLDKRIDSLDKRIDALDRRIDALDKRIDALDRRIDGLDKRIDFVAKMTMILTGSVIATLVANIVIRLLAG